MTAYWTDTTQPFLALVERALGPKYPPNWTLQLLLVNLTEVEMTDVRVESGGHYSDPDIGLVESKGEPKHFASLAAGGFVIVEQEDPDELVDFVIGGASRMNVAVRNKPCASHFSKGTDGVDISDVPIVGGQGELMQRWDFPSRTSP